MNIEVLLTEAEIAQELNESLEALDLPEKFFYWLPLSVRAWRNREQGSSYRDLARMWELLSAKIGGIVVGFPQVVPVVSLGAGDGDKDRTLIQAIQRLGKTVKYFPVDASQALLETACGAAEDDDIEVLGIKADISSPMHVILASRRGGISEAVSYEREHARWIRSAGSAQAYCGHYEGRRSVDSGCGTVP